MCYAQTLNVKLFLFQFAEVAEQLYVFNLLYKTRRLAFKGGNLYFTLLVIGACYGNTGRGVFKRGVQN